MSSETAWFVILMLVFLLFGFGAVMLNLAHQLSDLKWALKNDHKFIRDYQTDIAFLKKAIKKHRDAAGHERCWLNDMELYKVIEPAPDKMNMALPPLPEFMNKCAAYWSDNQPEQCKRYHERSN